jgi:hypothetical protein
MTTALQLTTSDIPALPPDDIATLYAQWTKLKPIMQQLEKRLKIIIEEDGICGDYTITERDGNRTITDIPAAFALLSSYGLLQEDFLSCCTIKVTALEKAFVESECSDPPVKGEKKSAKELFSEFMAPVIESGKPVRSVVKAPATPFDTEAIEI